MKKSRIQKDLLCTTLYDDCLDYSTHENLWKTPILYKSYFIIKYLLDC